MKRKFFYKIVTGIMFTFTSIFSLQALAEKNVITNISPSNSNVLFIQVANAGELIPIPGEADTYKLTLKNVDPFTSYFTDRPNRVTGILPTNQFVKLWRSQDIKTTPPNVALETSNIKNGKRINRILVLSDPIYDIQKQQINYTAKVLDKNTSPIGKLSIGYTVLFIDDFNWNGNKFG